MVVLERSAPTAAPPEPPTPIRHRKWPRRLLIGANIFLAVCVVGTAAAYGYFRYQFGGIPTLSVPGLRNAGVDVPGAPMNVLLVGSDTRATIDPKEKRSFGSAAAVGGQRSDTIIILRVDPRAKRAAMLSIPRDLYVPIAGTKTSSRINNAFEGGPGRLISTINEELGIPIDHYVELDFNGFRSIVQAVGGVPIYSPARARDRVTGLDIQRAGCISLDGNQALAYVRSRNYQYQENGKWKTDPTGDIGRIQRQQDFVRRVVRKAGQKARGLNVVAIQRLVNSGKRNVKIDDAFSSKDIVGLAVKFKSLEPDTVDMLTIPTVDARIGGAAVLRMKQPEASQVIDRFRSVGTAAAPRASAARPAPAPNVDPHSVRVRVLNGSGASGQATDVAKGLQQAGFNVAGIGEADSFRYVNSVIAYGRGQRDKALLLQSKLQGGVDVREDPGIRGIDLVLITGGEYGGVVGQAAPPTSTGVPPAAAPTAGAQPKAPPKPAPATPPC